MKNLVRPVYAIAFIALFAVNTQAQSLEPVKAQMIKDWERAKEYTREYLNTVPGDKYSFRPTDTIRTFAQQMLHLASGNIFLMSQVSTDTPPAGINFGLEQRSTAQNKDSVMHYVMASYDYALNIVKNMSTANWFDAKKMWNKYNETKFSLMGKAFEHQTHHRGQTTIYIRMLGLRPPAERLY